MSKYFAIRDWEKHQHYKTRRPPWIKFYTEIIEELDSNGQPHETFLLSDSAKLTLSLVWLLASHYGGKVPDRGDRWLRQRLGISKVNTKELLAKGYLAPTDDAINNASIDASAKETKVLAPPSNINIENREQRQRTETDSPASSPSEEPSLLPPPVVFLSFPCEGRVKRWDLTEDVVAEWQTIYPSLDVKAEMRKAQLKIKSGAMTKKTSGGMPKAMLSWLDRTTNGYRPPQSQSPPDANAEVNRRAAKAAAIADAAMKPSK